MQASKVSGCSSVSQTLSIGALKVNLPYIINQVHLLRFGVILVFGCDSALPFVTTVLLGL